MRTILHSDLNAFYASAETARDGRYRDVPFAVVGNAEERKGVILAKNQLAKERGVRTGEAIWEARKKCPALVTKTADFPYYLSLSRTVRKIYERYTDLVEPYGVDECWLDVTDSLRLFGSGEEIAEQIRAAVKAETGLTVSVGVSFNKIFAKLASEVKKPDAVTVISKDNYKTAAWRLPAEDLLYVGRSTAAKLRSLGVRTIGDLAAADVDLLVAKLGKWGWMLHTFARGEDHSPVRAAEEEESAKSIGNSMTLPRDLVKSEDIRAALLLLSESVAERLAESGRGRAAVVRVFARSPELRDYQKQTTLSSPTKTSATIAREAAKLFFEVYPAGAPVRAVGVTVSGFTGPSEQVSLFCDEAEEKREKVESAVLGIRRKYGHGAVARAAVMKEFGHSLEKDGDERTIPPGKSFDDGGKG